MMSMKFDLIKFLKHLDAQFNTEDDLEKYKASVTEALLPFRFAVAGPGMMHNIMDAVLKATIEAHTQGRLHAPDGITPERLDKNPKTYIDWVGTTDENAGRVAHVNPLIIHELFYQTMLRYFQTQFDAGGWGVDKAPDSPKITVSVPGEMWTFKIEMTQELLPQ
jgi:hypothetical protein